MTCASELRDCPLHEAPAGQRVAIVSLTVPPNNATRLAQHGLRVGAVVRVKRVAPLGGAILVEAGGHTVALGRSLASAIQVQVLP